MKKIIDQFVSVYLIGLFYNTIQWNTSLQNGNLLFLNVIRVPVYIIAMAESKDEILSPDNSDDQIKFRDPLISGFDASDGEVCILYDLGQRNIRTI